MEFDRSERQFQFLTEVELAAVPTKGDKIVLNLGEEPIGFMFEVYDVHYADHSATDVNVIRLGTVLEYFGKRYPDIS